MTSITDTRLRLVGAVVSLALVAFAVARVSSAAFTSTDDNGESTWDSGSVVLTVDDEGQILFTETDLVPGVLEERCVDVTYSGDVAAAVTLYGVDPSGTLDAYLDLTIERLDGPCDTSTTVVDTYDNTLEHFVDTLTVANGFGTWAPGSETTVGYVFNMELQDTNDAQNQSAAVTFTWTATSTGDNLP
jgi:hypothetical protein